MFKILWLEDEVGTICDFAPAILEIPGISVSALIFGDDGGVKINRVDINAVACPERGLTLDEAWQHLMSRFKAVRPWILISDLRLSTIKADISLKTSPQDDPQIVGQDDSQAGADGTTPKKTPMAGISLAYLLFKKTDCRNVIWLTMHGPDVTRQTGAFVKKTVERVDGAKREYIADIIEFPRTYVLYKKAPAEHLKYIVEQIVSSNLARLREGDALLGVQASTVKNLFRVLFAHAGSVRHYFKSPLDSELRNRIQALSTLDLLPFNDPPMNFDTWFRAWSLPDQIPLENVTSQNNEAFVKGLIPLLANKLWGMKISELLPLMNTIKERLSNIHADFSELESVRDCALDKVIGPIVRDSLVCAFTNAFQNAVKATTEAQQKAGQLKVKCCSKDDAIYILVQNPADVEKVRVEMLERAQHESLNGIMLIRGAIQELNELHPRQERSDFEFGGWGFAYFVGGTKLADDSFTAGARLTQGQINELFAIQETGKDSVAIVFRLPLETPADLAFKSSKSPKKNAKVAQAGLQQTETR